MPKSAKRKSHKVRKSSWYNKRYGLYVAAFAVIAVLGAVYIRTSHAAVLAEWNVQCGIDHYGKDDPIVFPGKPGVSHMHSFYGNKTTSAYSTAASINAGADSCDYISQLDHSAYWVPSVYSTNPDGSSTQYTDGRQNLTAYYRRPGGSSGPKVQPFPKGLMMIAGNAAATSPQSVNIIQWDCGEGGLELSYMQTCPGGASGQVHASVIFPNCWDGVHLDSADHKSHMAYPTNFPDGGTCPADHPVSLPQVTYEVDYPYLAGGSNYYLSSGGKYSMHGDFVEGWNTPMEAGLIDNCLNSKQNSCHTIQVSGSSVTINGGVSLFNLNNYASATTPPASPTPPPAPKPSPSPSPVPKPTTPSPTPTPTPTSGGTTGSTTGNPNGSPFPGGSLAPDPSATTTNGSAPSNASSESTITPSSAIVSTLDNVKKPLFIGGAVLAAIIVFVVYKLVRRRRMPWQ